MELVSCFVPIYMPILVFLLVVIFFVLFCVCVLPVVETGALVTANPDLSLGVDTVHCYQENVPSLSTVNY